MLQGHHPKVPEDSEDRLKIQDLYLIQPETNLNSTSPRSRLWGVARQIGTFIDLRLVKCKADFPWQERKNPLGK